MVTSYDAPALPPEDIRRVRRLLAETQVQFARRLGVDPVTVARWETGQRRCTGAYAEAIVRLDPERPAPAGAAPRVARDKAKLSALAQLVRTLFDGSTTQAVSALLEEPTLSSRDLDQLEQLIEAKRKLKKKEGR